MANTGRSSDRDAELSCVICLSGFVEPTTTACGHSFDLHCLPPQVTRCPICRETLHFHEPPRVNVALRDAVRALDPRGYADRVKDTENERQAAASAWSAHFLDLGDGIGGALEGSDSDFDGTETADEFEERVAMISPNSNANAASLPFRAFDALRGILLGTGTPILPVSMAQNGTNGSPRGAPRRTRRRRGDAMVSRGRRVGGNDPARNADRCSRNACLATLAFMFVIVFLDALNAPMDPRAQAIADLRKERRSQFPS